jgi:hypothetical protein
MSGCHLFEATVVSQKDGMGWIGGINGWDGMGECINEWDLVDRWMNKWVEWMDGCINELDRWMAGFPTTEAQDVVIHATFGQ